MLTSWIAVSLITCPSLARRAILLTFLQGSHVYGEIGARIILGFEIKMLDVGGKREWAKK